MDAVLLARIQFSITIMFHFIFPAITIGLSLLIAIIETLRWRTGKDLYRRMSDFWLLIFAITFAVGVASGIVMEFQFGTNWASYSRFVGDIFGAPLAAEGVLAFFLESAFLGLLLFGRNRISSFVRWFAAVMVWLGTTLSAFWIIVANSWMQTPAGYEIVDGKARLVDFHAAVFNPSTLPRYFHTVISSIVCASFLMMAISAWYFLKRRPNDVARMSLRIGTIVALISVIAVMFTGDVSAKQVARTQEAKFAAMEGLYTTTEGAPLVLFSLPPRQDGKPVGPELVITNLTSFLAFGDFRAPVKGLEEFPREDWPPVAITFLSFHNMVIIGNILLLQALIGVYLLWKKRLTDSRRWLAFVFWTMPLPMIAIQLGWTAAEVGRQPWIVYGLMRTSEGVSRVVSAPEILASIILFSFVYTLLGGCWLYLMRKKIVKGPEGAPEPAVSQPEVPPTLVVEPAAGTI